MVASTLQVPELLVVVSVCPPTVTVTVGLPCSLVVPEIEGVVSFVDLEAPPLIVTTGAVTSTVRTWVAVPTFREASVIVATTLCDCAASALALTPQTPPAPTVELKVCPPTVTVTAEPTGSSVVPEIVGDVSFVERVGPPLMVTTGAVRSSMGSVKGLFASATVLGVRIRPLIACAQVFMQRF